MPSNKIRAIFIIILLESQMNCTLWQAVLEFKYFSNYFRCCRLVDQNNQKRKHTNCFRTHTHHTSVQKHLVMFLENKHK